MLKTIAMAMMVTASLATPKFSQREMSTEIYALQSRLASLGYFNIKVTGMYGSLTENIFKQYQYANGFEVTGIATEEEINHLYSFKAKPLLDSKRNIPVQTYLSGDSFSIIDTKVTQSFEIKLVTVDKTATFNVKSSQGHLIGELTNIDTKKLNEQLHYPVIATIQGVNYPASMDFSGNTARLHFKDSISYLGIPDSEHQFNINSLLGL